MVIKMDKLHIDIPVEKNGKLFRIMGAWGEDGNVNTYVTTACTDETEEHCGNINNGDCLHCPFTDKKMEETLLEQYQDKMYDAMKAVKEIFRME
jgi:hypothetical protein